MPSARPDLVLGTMACRCVLIGVIVSRDDAAAAFPPAGGRPGALKSFVRAHPTQQSLLHGSDNAAAMVDAEGTPKTGDPPEATSLEVRCSSSEAALSARGLLRLAWCRSFLLIQFLRMFAVADERI